MKYKTNKVHQICTKITFTSTDLHFDLVVQFVSLKSPVIPPVTLTHLGRPFVRSVARGLQWAESFLRLLRLPDFAAKKRGALVRQHIRRRRSRVAHRAPPGCYTLQFVGGSSGISLESASVRRWHVSRSLSLRFITRAFDVMRVVVSRSRSKFNVSGAQDTTRSSRFQKLLID